MVREEFKKIVMAMKAVYTFDNFIADQSAFDVWFSLLSDLPYNKVSLAVQKFMQTSTKVPTIADIRNLCTDEKELNENEAWTLVYKAICKANYYADEEFEKLPELVQKAVGSPTQLRMWAQDSEFNEGVASSQFNRVYRTLVERARKDNVASESVRIAEQKLKGIEDKGDADV